MFIAKTIKLTGAASFFKAEVFACGHQQNSRRHQLGNFRSIRTNVY
jgi:hypothetical protein